MYLCLFQNTVLESVLKFCLDAIDLPFGQISATNRFARIHTKFSFQGQTFVLFVPFVVN
jgi:hypothetical protein